MANASLLHALQRVVDTTRKTTPNSRSVPTIQDTPSVLESLPEHKSLLPLLLSHNIPSRLAKACSDRYDGFARQLRSKTESKLTPYLAYQKKSHPAQAYPLFLNNYNQTLHRWSQSILNMALISLKRDSVELQNFEATHLAPLRLSLLLDRGPARSGLDHNCPLSPTPRPTHAFPTPYPPPLRPSPGVPSVKWPHTSGTSPTPCAISIDSLCNLFATSLTIDENRRRPWRSKPSIFSLPIVAKEEPDMGHHRPKPLKKKHSTRANKPPALPATSLGISLPEAAKPRRHSVPPYPSSPPRTKATLRKISTPPQQSKFLDPTQLTGPTTPTSLLNASTAGDPNTYPSYIPSALLNQPPLDSTPDISTPRGLSYTLAGPTTPPAYPPHLFPEPVVVPATPVRLSPRSSLMPITDPFLQFEPQYDYFTGLSLGSTLNYGPPAPELATGGFFPKSTFDTPLGFDHLFHINLTPTPFDLFENPLLTT